MLAFPLGIIYFVGIVTGAAFGFGLLITLVGLPILLLTVLGAIAIAGVEAQLARRLVGVEVRVPPSFASSTRAEACRFPGTGSGPPSSAS